MVNVECPDCGWQTSTEGSPWTVMAAHKPHCAANKATCDVCEDIEWLVHSGETDPAMVAARIGKTPAALEMHLRRCRRADLKDRLPGLSALASNPKPIATTTKETPMEAAPNRRPPLADLKTHDDPKVARLAAKAQDAIVALDAALEDYNGKAAARARVAELEKQLAEAKAALRGKPTTKPAPQAAPAKVDYKAVRAWAEANGYDIPKVGRISGEIVAAYDEAMRGGAA